jgi:predicted amidohydrolase YtcJ
VLTGATVIDGSGRPPRRNTALVLAGGQNAAIGTLAERSLPRGARVVDLSGKYVVPGLWDMHVHTVPLDAVYPPLYIVNGVTGVREMYAYASRCFLGCASGSRAVR